MKELNLPEYSFRITGSGEKEMILDVIRKKYVRLTPEEWVRQNFIRYLMDKGKYPPGLIGVEVMSPFNKLRKRVDILIHDRSGKPVMIVECKSWDVNLNETVFDQIVCYNLGFRVPYIVVTNGLENYACKVRDDWSGYDHLMVIPLYEDLQR